MDSQRKGCRYEICYVCKLHWNVSKSLKVGEDGYKCPGCTAEKERRENER